VNDALLLLVDLLRLPNFSKFCCICHLPLLSVIFGKTIATVQKKWNC